MDSNQLRAARHLLGWTQAQLADAAEVSIPTVKRAEGGGALGASERAIQAIRGALESAGVIFLDPNGGGAGVRLRK
jgi:transcriptional regulator with XRE-family HTH domain